MKLTPIKIPSKRWAANNPNKPQKKEKKRKQGSSLVDEKQVTRKSKKLRKTVSRTSFSFRKNGKQHIPIDVLEQIFLYSENTAFPRVNHHLGFLLSGELTLIRTIHVAFGPTWAAYWEGLGGEAGHLQAGDDCGNPEFQTSVLAAPWAKFDILQKAFILWTRKRPDWDARFLHGFHGENFNPHDGKPCLLAQLHECYNEDYAMFRETGGKDCMMRDTRHGDPIRPTLKLIHPKTKVPSSLISGPWDTWEKIQRLFWLVRMGAQLNQLDHWEVSLEGYHRLEHFQNTAARDMLRSLFHMFEFWREWPDKDSANPHRQRAERNLPKMPLPIENMLEDNGPKDEDPFPYDTETILGSKGKYIAGPSL